MIAMISGLKEMLDAKGQLISEWLFDALNFPENQNKKFDEFLP